MHRLILTIFDKQHLHTFKTVVHIQLSLSLHLCLRHLFFTYTVKDIVTLEGVLRRFTKKLTGLHSYCYQDRLHRFQLLSLELRRLYSDLVWWYKILFGIADVQSNIISYLMCVLLEDISTKYKILCPRGIQTCALAVTVCAQTDTSR